MRVIGAVRSLHEALLREGTTEQERKKLASRIDALLISAEATAPLPNRARILFLRLRIAAHLIAEEGSEDVITPSEIDEIYSEIERLLN